MDYKIASAVSPQGDEVLSRHARQMYRTPGSCRYAIVQLRRESATIPDPNATKAKAVVTIALGEMEIANDEQETLLVEAMRALTVHRTSKGTFDEEGAVSFSDAMLRALGGRLDRTEVARLRAGIHHWVDEIQKMLMTDPTEPEAVRYLDAVRTGLLNLTLVGHVDDDETTG